MFVMDVRWVDMTMMADAYGRTFQVEVEDLAHDFIQSDLKTSNLIYSSITRVMSVWLGVLCISNTNFTSYSCQYVGSAFIWDNVELLLSATLFRC